MSRADRATNAQSARESFRDQVIFIFNIVRGPQQRGLARLVLQIPEHANVPCYHRVCWTRSSVSLAETKRAAAFRCRKFRGCKQFGNEVPTKARTDSVAARSGEDQPGDEGVAGEEEPAGLAGKTPGGGGDGEGDGAAGDHGQPRSV